MDDGTQRSIGTVYDELGALREHVTDPDARRRLDQAMHAITESRAGPFGNVIVGFDRSDAGEALLGSLIFGIPMFVEGGTLEVGAHLATRPSMLVVTLLAAVGFAITILYVADIQDVRIHEPLLGVVPRRLAGVLTIALVTALVVMTVWGRVDWATPWLAANQVAVAFVPMVVGGALGDILPGT